MEAKRRLSRIFLLASFLMLFLSLVAGVDNTGSEQSVTLFGINIPFVKTPEQLLYLLVAVVALILLIIVIAFIKAYSSREKIKPDKSYEEELIQARKAELARERGVKVQPERKIEETKEEKPGLFSKLFGKKEQKIGEESEAHLIAAEEKPQEVFELPPKEEKQEGLGGISYEKTNVIAEIPEKKEETPATEIVEEKGAEKELKVEERTEAERVEEKPSVEIKEESSISKPPLLEAEPTEEKVEEKPALSEEELITVDRIVSVILPKKDKYTPEQVRKVMQSEGYNERIIEEVIRRIYG